MCNMPVCDRFHFAVCLFFLTLTLFGVRFCVDRLIRHVVFYCQEDTHWSVTHVLRLFSYLCDFVWIPVNNIM